MAVLDDAQLVVLRADFDVETQPGGDLENVGGDNTGITNYYNTPGNVWVFRSKVTTGELSNSIDLQDIVDITSADSDRVLKMFTIRASNGGSFDGRDLRTRSAWNDVFSAAAGDKSQQAIALLWQQIATNCEDLFLLSTGPGIESDPDTTSFEGSIDIDDVRAMRAL